MVKPIVRTPKAIVAVAIEEDTIEVIEDENEMEFEQAEAEDNQPEEEMEEDMPEVSDIEVNTVTVAYRQQFQFAPYQTGEVVFTLSADVKGNDPREIMVALQNMAVMQCLEVFPGLEAEALESGALRLIAKSFPGATATGATGASKPSAPANGATAQRPAARPAQAARATNGPVRPPAGQKKVLDWEGLAEVVREDGGFGSRVYYNETGTYGPNINASKAGLGYFSLEDKQGNSTMPDWFVAEFFG